MKKNLIISIVSLITIILKSQTNDSLRLNNKDSIFYHLEEIEVTAPDDIKYIKDNNTFEFDVVGTKFEKQNNLIQSLRLLPQINIQNNEIKFANQKCFIEINGNVIEISNEELINLVNSIDPSNVSKIQITTNSYKYGDKSTVINILLKQNPNQYKISAQTTNGSRYNYYNESSLNALVVTNNVWNINIFNFKYLPYYYNGYLRKITNIENTYADYIEKNKDKNFFDFNQFKLDLPKNNKCIFNFYYNKVTNKNESISFNSIQNLRETHSYTNENHYFAESIFDKAFNDSLNLKIGALFFQKESQQLLSQNLYPVIDNQIINTRIPFFRFKSDGSILKTKYKIHFGFKTYHLNIQSNSVWNNIYNDRFFYIENSLNSYFTFETSFKKVNFNINLSHEYTHLSNKTISNGSTVLFNYTLNTPLVNFNFNWEQNNQFNHSISLNNLVIKPDYNNFNSITSISNQLFFTTGSQNMKPSTAYQFNYSSNYKNIFISINFNYIKNFISNVIEFNSNQNQMVNTYKNFEKILSSDLSFSWSKDILPNTLFIKINNTFSYFKLLDKNYSLHSTTPVDNLDITILFSINKIQSSINYYFTSDYYDGIFYHKLLHYPNLIVSYMINNRLKIFLEINDPFKTNLSDQFNTLLPYYYYQSKVYYDYKMFNVLIKYTLHSKNFKKFEIENSSNDVERF